MRGVATLWKLAVSAWSANDESQRARAREPRALGPGGECPLQRARNYRDIRSRDQKSDAITKFTDLPAERSRPLRKKDQDIAALGQELPTHVQTLTGMGPAREGNRIEEKGRREFPWKASEKIIFRGGGL